MRPTHPSAPSRRAPLRCRQVDALLAAASKPDITRALFSATLPEKVPPVGAAAAGRPPRHGQRACGFAPPGRASVVLAARIAAHACPANWAERPSPARRPLPLTPHPSTPRSPTPLSNTTPPHPTPPPPKVEDLARTLLRDPLRVTVGERNTSAAVVAQRLVFAGREEGKLVALRQMLAGGLAPPVLVRGRGGGVGRGLLGVGKGGRQRSPPLPTRLPP